MERSYTKVSMFRSCHSPCVTMKFSDSLVRVVSLLKVPSFILLSVKVIRKQLWGLNVKHVLKQFWMIWCHLPSVVMDANVMLQCCVSKGNSCSFSWQVAVRRWRALTTTQPLEVTLASVPLWVLPLSEALREQRRFEWRAKRKWKVVTGLIGLLVFIKLFSCLSAYILESSRQG